MKTSLTIGVLVIMGFALFIGYAAMCTAAREDRYSDQYREGFDDDDYDWDDDDEEE